MLVEGCLGEKILFPKIWGQISIGLSEGIECGLDKVSKSLGASTRGGEHIIDSCEGQNLLWDSGGDNSSTTRGGNKTKTNRSTLASDFGWDSVRSSDLISPISSSDWNHREFGQNDSTTNGCGNFFGTFNSKTQMSVVISNNDKSFESGSLSCSGLFLYRHDLHYFVFQFW